MKRRRFLGTAGVVAASLAGCIGSSMPKDAVVRAMQESPPVNATLVSADTLPQPEQQIAQTAVEKGFYHACPELPDVLHSFSNRFDQPNNAYLEYNGADYALWIRISDTVVAGTASPPESQPSCGFFDR